MPDPNPTGLTVTVLRPAPKGRVLQTGDLVGVYYQGTLTDGTQFDANFNFSGFQPVRPNLFVFTLGQNKVIKGWEQGLLNRRIGEVLELRIPPELGYGPNGTTGIPGNATLVFRVMLVGTIPASQLSLPAEKQQPIYFDLNALGLTLGALKITRAVLSTLAPASLTPNLVGTNVDDVLNGTASAELLVGQQGNDALTGAAGRDVQVGGKGYDRFIFANLGDSLNGADKRDLITDFKGGASLGDRLDLSAIDADSTLLGDQAFRFVGKAAFSGVAGELRYFGGVVSVDVNGDRQADMEIGLLGAPKLMASDVIL